MIPSPDTPIVAQARRTETVIAKSLKGKAAAKAVDAEPYEFLEFKDQGYTRPRVLVVVPMKHSAYKLVNDLIELFGFKEVANLKRFLEEFGAEDADTTPGDSDFAKTFHGNIEDEFKIGLSTSKRRMKLYSDFYDSDIIIASPLGLRLVTGGPDDEHREIDFLSSVEVVVVDQTETLMMQNWEHTKELFDALNITPTKPRDTDFSRVRDWNLSNRAACFRQTLIFSSLQDVRLSHLLRNQCKNFAGATAVVPTHDGSITEVTTGSMRQMFRRVGSTSVDTFKDDMFEAFKSHVLPHLRSGATDEVNAQPHTLIYVPDYLDHVRIRNMFLREELEFNQITEYLEAPDVSRAKSHFETGRVPLLLFSERFHYFRRDKLRGIRHIVFYGVPTFPSFYTDLVNRIDAPPGEVTSTLLMWSRFEGTALSRVVGTERAGKMLNAERSTFVFM